MFEELEPENCWQFAGKTTNSIILIAADPFSVDQQIE